MLKYELSDEFLGKGQFGEVFKGRERSTGKAVAIKVTSKRVLAGSPKKEQQLRQEVALMRRLAGSCPHVVKLLDVETTAERVHLVLELCAGGDLARRLQRAPRRRLGPAAARRYLRHLAAGLRAIWSANLLHRDLKPQNLLLTHYDDDARALLKIADFGFVRQLEEGALAETQCGSPLYMAPEILDGKSYHATCDLWSVGVILFQMLTGSPPYKGKNALDLRRNIGGRVIVPRDVQLSKDAISLLKRLLVPDPLRRAGYEEFFAHSYLQEEDGEEKEGADDQRERGGALGAAAAAAGSASAGKGPGGRLSLQGLEPIAEGSGATSPPPPPPAAAAAAAAALPSGAPHPRGRPPPPQQGGGRAAAAAAAAVAAAAGGSYRRAHSDPDALRTFVAEHTHTHLAVHGDPHHWAASATAAEAPYYRPRPHPQHHPGRPAAAFQHPPPAAQLQHHHHHQQQHRQQHYHQLHPGGGPPPPPPPILEKHGSRSVPSSPELRGLLAEAAAAAAAARPGGDLRAALLLGGAAAAAPAGPPPPPPGALRPLPPAAAQHQPQHQHQTPPRGHHTVMQMLAGGGSYQTSAGQVKPARVPFFGAVAGAATPPTAAGLGGGGVHSSGGGAADWEVVEAESSGGLAAAAAMASTGVPGGGRAGLGARPSPEPWYGGGAAGGAAAPGRGAGDRALGPGFGPQADYGRYDPADGQQHDSAPDSTEEEEDPADEAAAAAAQRARALLQLADARARSALRRRAERAFLRSCCSGGGGPEGGAEGEGGGGGGAGEGAAAAAGRPAGDGREPFTPRERRALGEALALYVDAAKLSRAALRGAPADLAPSSAVAAAGGGGGEGDGRGGGGGHRRPSPKAAAGLRALYNAAAARARDCAAELRPPPAAAAAEGRGGEGSPGGAAAAGAAATAAGGGGGGDLPVRPLAVLLGAARGLAREAGAQDLLGNTEESIAKYNEACLLLQVLSMKKQQSEIQRYSFKQYTDLDCTPHTAAAMFGELR